MSSADEVSRMNALNRAHIVTSSATRTLLVVDRGKVILNLDCSLGAGLLALAASDTAV